MDWPLHRLMGPVDGAAGRKQLCAALGLGVAYAGSNREEVLAVLRDTLEIGRAHVWDASDTQQLREKKVVVVVFDVVVVVDASAAVT